MVYTQKFNWTLPPPETESDPETVLISVQFRTNCLGKVQFDYGGRGSSWDLTFQGGYKEKKPCTYQHLEITTLHRGLTPAQE